MRTQNELKLLAAKANEAAIEAGKAILKIYEGQFDVEYKADQSPLTIADKTAHGIIVAMLEDTKIPVLSEEGKAIPWEERSNWPCLWVVDPLDGTKEFIKRNDEFTVNIALVHQGQPVLGVIYVPVFDELFYGLTGAGAWRTADASGVKATSFEDWAGMPLPQAHSLDYVGVVASRSHLSPETGDFIEELKSRKEKVEVVSRGSSLKLCMLAEGRAHVYPRFGPTYEWDTAAGHAILLSAGGHIVLADDPGHTLQYNNPDLLNPWFIAYAPGWAD